MIFMFSRLCEVLYLNKRVQELNKVFVGKLLVLIVLTGRIIEEDVLHIKD
ncbi:hypothetical protein SAMN05216231_1990 [Virgibacillus salinus]|uniref:Uncharacterized protein n=1 Tax=Virgibacillus salinus TaxID=553311 RepID=A0A1H1BZ29_9BACI|nr:hypothetical protein SAMN05216231_1990 [Virgibacillus salinus]